MKLLELERAMAHAVMQPLTGTYGMRKKTASGASVADEVARFIKPNKQLSSFERLEIYNRQYWFRILSALAEDFPGLQTTVGKRQFATLARAYLEANPSRSFTMRNLGSNMEAWLRANPAYAGDRHAVALDVVRLEWAYVEAFDGGQQPALALEDIAALGPDSCLSLQPHLRLLDLQFAVDDFIIDVHRRQRSSGISSNAVSRPEGQSNRRHPKNFLPSPIFLAVHRFDNAVYYVRLMPEAYRLLSSLQQGASLGTALGKGFGESSIPAEEHPAHIREWFLRWAELGWFCRQAKDKVPPRREKPQQQKSRRQEKEK